MKKDYGMLMPFIDESHEFVNGFECGQIWEKLKIGNTFCGYMVHTENSAQIQMICDYYVVPCKIMVNKDDPGWSLFWTTSFPDELFEDLD